jgi:TRAP-type mannitol/chloroaromatic compound transport system substrate-binding protein
LFKTKTSVRRAVQALAVSAIAIAAVVQVPGSAMAQKAERIRWSVPIAFSSSLIALGDVLPWVAKRLEEQSGGNIKFEVFEPGKVVPGNEIFDAVSTGKVDAGFSWMGYELGKVPASVLFGARPFGFTPWEYMAWYYFGGGQDLVKEVFAPHNVVPIFCGIVSPETAGWFRFEITSLDQVKGLKIRFAGLGGKVMQKLGASVTVMPAGELQQALEKGVLDATEFSIPTADEQLGFFKVAKYNYFPGWHQPYTSQFLYVNKAAWDKISPESRAMIETTCMAGVNYSLTKSEASQAAVLKRYRDAGITTTQLSPAILGELKKVTREVMAEEAAKDAMFKKVMDSQDAFEAAYGNWRGLAFLPSAQR